jgi:response regulator NasT
MLLSDSEPSLERLSVKSDIEILAGKRIVIIEDEGLTQLQLQTIVTKAGIALAGTAPNGRIGVDTVLRERPDIVLMDIKMPVMNGLEAATEILRCRCTCIVMLSAYSEEAIKSHVQGIGISGCVVKPISRETLLPELAAAYRRFTGLSV